LKDKDEIKLVPSSDRKKNSPERVGITILICNLKKINNKITEIQL